MHFQDLRLPSKFTFMTVQFERTKNFQNSDRDIMKLFKVDKWSDWFKHAEFYYVALLYMLTRMIVNITATYIPFYLQISLNLE